MDWKNGVLAGIFLACILVPGVQTWRPLLPEKPLAGAETPAARETFTVRSWWRGDYQRSLETWFDRGLGMRSWFVRTDNQFRLTLFGQVRPGGTPIVRGRDDWLFEKAYVDKYNLRVRLAPKRLRREVEDLRRLRDLLAARGTALVVVVAPSKAEVYPDYLPASRIVPGREVRRTAYDQLAPLLASSDLEVVDGHRILLEERLRSGTPLFPRGGTHWNHYGAALVTERILEAVDRQLPGRFVTAAVEGSRSDREVWGADADLAYLLNIWHEAPFVGTQIHPVFGRRQEDRAAPRALFVGDSFSLTLIRIMTEEAFMAPGDVLYYFKRRIRFPEESSESFDPQTFPVARELEGIDAVILVTGEFYLPDVGFGFVEAALSALSVGGAVPGSPP